MPGCLQKNPENDQEDQDQDDLNEEEVFNTKRKDSEQPHLHALV